MFEWRSTKKGEDMNIAEGHYTIEQAAEILQVNPVTARAYLKDLRIPFEKFGTTIAVEKKEIHSINKYKILDYIRKLTGIDDPKICDEDMNAILKASK